MPFRRDDAVRDRQAGGGGERAARREPQSAAEQVLALQRSAGNQAVNALLARDAAPADTKGGAGKTDEAAVGNATVSGIGVIPLLSFQNRVEGAGARETKTEFVLTSKVGSHSAALTASVAKGAPLTIEVELKNGFKVKLEEAYISSYTTSDSQGETIETWTIVPGRTSVGDDEKDKPKPPSWDLGEPRPIG